MKRTNAGKHKTSAKPSSRRNTFTCHSASGVGVIKRPVGNLFSKRLTSSADRVACLRRYCCNAEQQQQQQQQQQQLVA
ncbi:Autophagy-related protein [Trichinella pseudospiralis]